MLKPLGIGNLTEPYGEHSLQLHKTEHKKKSRAEGRATPYRGGLSWKRPLRPWSLAVG